MKSINTGADLIGPVKQILQYAQEQGATTLRFTGKFINQGRAEKFGLDAEDTFDITVDATREGVLNLLKKLQ